MPVESTIDLDALKANENIIARKYWENRLLDFEFKTCFERNFHQLSVTPAYTLYTETASEEVRDSLEDLAKSDKAKHIVLLSALGILMHKYSSVTDLCLFSPGYLESSARKTQGLPVRMSAFSDVNFQDFLINLRSELIQDSKNGDYPIEKILNREKSALHELPLIGMLLEGVQDAEALTDLSPDILFSFISREELSLKIKYDHTKYDAQYITQLGTLYFRLLKNLINNRNINITRIELLTEEERHQLIYGFNQTAADYAENETILTLFEDQVRKTPDQIAVGFGNQSLTYQELNSVSDQIAAYLIREKEVLPGDLVGLMLEREEYLIPSVYGILKAGGVYVPVDPGSPAERKDSIIAGSGLKALITRTEFYGDSLTSLPGIIDLNKALGSILAVPLTEKPEVGGNDLAYVIYTSGSTGKPKGVMIAHHSLVNRILWMQKTYPISDLDVILQKTPLVFDVSVWELFWWAVTGASVHLLKPGGEKDPDEIIRTISTYKITTLHFVPSMLHVFLSVLTPGFDFEILKNLRLIFASGEALKTGQVNQFGYTLNKFCNTRLINLYGPTEATVDVSYYECTFEQECTQVPIGKPIDNISLYILDAYKDVVPVGVSGELHIAGAGLARGYLNNPQLTGEKFIEHPFIEGQKVYQTGDWARWLPDGNIEFLGRIDNQVKIRGIRIEPGEIENHLIAIPLITDAAVLVRETGSEYLVAYYVSPLELDQRNIKSLLSAVLPDYMVPVQYIHLQSLPLNANGKLDRKALLGLAVQETIAYKAPVNETEATLAEIWSSLLGTEKKTIGTGNDFFDLGGNSLNAVFLKNKIAQRFGVMFSIAEVFTYKTIQEQAGIISSRKIHEVKNLIKTTSSEYYLLSPAQKRLYFLYHFDKNTTAYNMPAVIRIRGELNIEALTKACHTLLERHDLLRTAFILMDGIPVQQVMDKSDFKIDFYDVQDTAADIIVQDFRRPFELSKAPLFRVGLVSEGSSDYLLMFDIHHIIADGVSLNILIKEFMSLYRGDILPDLSIQYQDYVAWLQEEQQQAKIVQQQEYWLNEFNDIPSVLNLPADFNRTSQKSFEGNTIGFELSAEETAELRRIAKEAGASLYMIILAIYNLFLSRVGHTEDVVIGTIMAGRQHTDLEELVGMFANTLAIRNKPEGNLTFLQFLANVKTKTLQSLDNQDFQYDALVDLLNLERNTSRNPLFDVFFVFQNQDMEELSLQQAEISAYQAAYQLSKFDLTLAAREMESGLKLEFEYATRLFKEGTINQFIRVFKEITSQLIGNSDILLSAVQLTNAAEKQELFLKYNRTGSIVPASQTLIGAFELQTQTYPGAVALEFQEEQLTYQQLNHRVNQLSDFLIRQGVKPDMIVGLFMERSVNMVIAILAILKAGGAYLPIDIDAPEERSNLYLEDCHAELLLTTRDLSGLTDQKWNRIFIDEFDWNTYSGENPSLIRRGDQLCYIIYTSGTTGKPKGVMVNDENLISLFFNEDFCFNFNAGDSWTMFHRYCFDFSVWEMYGALLFGGRLNIISKQDSMDPVAFLKILKEKKVTILNQTPTAFNNLMQQELLDKIPDLQLRYVIFGGEALHPGILRKWHARYPEVKLINMFGITETTIHVTYKELTTEDIVQNVSNIGEPLPALSVYVLDQYLNIVPKGFEGELYVGGKGVSRGYINNAELTAQKFLDNPYQPGDRLYKTGDLVKILENGDIEYKGRADNQVQLKGFRIELNEIEHALIKYRFINEAKVVMIEKDGDSFIVAYYSGDTEIKVTQLRKILSSSLPLYMVPSFFVYVARMPLTANGKVDLQKLPQPVVRISSDFVPPSNRTEEILAEIWIETLGLHQAGITDNYFGLGGDSITAIRLIASINKKLSVELKIADLYNHQTISELSDFISTCEAGEVSAEREQIIEELRLFHHNYVSTRNDENIEVVYPMSNIEKGMCYVHLKNMEDILYYEQLLWPVVYEDFNFENLKKAVGLLVSKHTALRTAFDMSEFAHLIYKTVSYDILFTDISHLYQDRQEEWIRIVMEESRKGHFSLDTAPLWKMQVFKLDQDHHLILFEIHHAISDGWSIATFMNELNNVYAEVGIYEFYQPVQLKSGYKDYITAELLYEKNSDNLNYWKNELADFKKFSFGITAREKEYKSIRIPFSEDLFRSLEVIAVKRNSSVKNIFFAAYSYTLKLLNFENDIVTGLVTFDRSFGEDSAGVFGNFLNTIPVRLKFEHPLDIKTLLDLVDQKLLEIKKHDKTSLYNINQAINGNAYGENPITDTLFNFTNFHSSYEISLEKTDHEDKNELELDSFIRGHSLFDLSVNVSKGDTFFAYQYVTSFINESTFRQFHQLYVRILELVSASYTGKLTITSVLPDQQVQQLLHRFNETAAEFPSGKTIVSLFKETVSSYPDRIAIVHAGKGMTYRELDEKSDLLADRLIQTGVKERSVIGIATERSFEMMIGVLGILKSGCAYLPVDPAYPKERSDFILKDTGVELLLTQQKFYTIFKDVVQVIDLEDQTLYVQAGELIKRNPYPEDIAYIIYTSGSTGRPKGVEIAHHSVINRLNWMQKAYPIDEQDVLLQKTPVTFDVSVWELFWGLFQGAKLIMLGTGEEKDPVQIVEAIRANRVTTIHFVPSMLNIFISNLIPEDIDKLRSLKYVFASGEALKPHVANEFNKILSGAALINLYGPTEATVDVSYFSCKTDQELTMVPIGKPIDNIQLYVLDKNGHLLPQGIAGELCIAGVGLARGYLNRPELNAEKFVIRKDSDQRIYKTGDLARWLPDGNIEYLGRIDTQIKLRGYRIELGEIEYQLRGYKGIREAVVIVREKEDHQNLVAYYVADGAITSDKLSSYLTDKLPEYMVPAYFVHLENFPLTPNGKLDNHALPDPKIGTNSNYVAPGNEVERQIVEIWQDLLSIEQVGVQDNFFNIGGSSFLAITMSNLINKKLGIFMPLKWIFETFTIAGITGKIQKSMSWESQLELNSDERVKTVVIAQMTKSEHKPFFFSAALGGILPATSIIGILDMAPYLKNVVSYYGVQAPAIKPDIQEAIENNQFVRMEDFFFEFSIFDKIVDEAIAEIFQIQGEGPYAIGGFCTGCVLALEIAKKLAEMGKEVENLVLIDPPGWLQGITKEDVAEDYTKDELAWFVAKDVGWSSSLMDLEALTAAISQSDRDQSWEICTAYLIKLNLVGETYQAKDLRHAFENKFYNDLALKYFFASVKYTYPKVVVGKTLILSTENISAMTEDQIDDIKSNFIGEVSIRPIPGDHHVLFQPQVLSGWAHFIAEHLK